MQRSMVKWGIGELGIIFFVASGSISNNTRSGDIGELPDRAVNTESAKGGRGGVGGPIIYILYWGKWRAVCTK